MTGWFSRHPGLLALVALVAGGAVTLAFAPFSLSPVALGGLALLFLLWRAAASPREAFRLGFLFGLGLMGGGVFWIHISIDQFGNVGLMLAVAVTLLFVAFMALYFGLAGWLGAKLGGGHRVRGLLLIYPSIWVVTEWFRGWFLTGFPWLALGYSQIDWPLQGYAPLLGVYGVSWVLALSAGLVALLWEYYRNASRGRPPRVALSGLVVLWAGGGALTFVEWTEPAGDPLTVSLIQGNVPQEIKWRPEQRIPTLELYSRLTRANWESDLVIWPETAVPAFYRVVDEAFLSPLEEEARRRNTDLLLGIPLLDAEQDRYYNGMVSLGRHRGAYRKRHLVPFGEFYPMKGLLQPLIDFLQIPMSDFSPGEGEKPLLKAVGFWAGISICYEDAFGDEVIQALPEAAFLVNASNDAWFGDSLAPPQHLEIARMRALETGRYLLRATNTGISAIIDPRGKLAGASPAFQEAVLTGEIIPRKGMTPYGRWGNVGVLILLLLLPAAGIVLTLKDGNRS